MVVFGSSILGTPEIVGTTFTGQVLGPSQYRTAVLASSPSIYWPLDTNATDASPNGRNGTPTNVTFSSPGPGGGLAATFNGTSSFIYENTLHPSAIAAWTLEAWYRGRGGVTTYTIAPTVGFGSGTFTPSTYLDANGLLSGFAFGMAVVQDPSSSNDGLWHYMVHTYNGANVMTLYRDGIQVSQVTSGTPQNNAGLGLQVGVGGSLSRGGWFTGDIAHVAIYAGTALSPATITSHWQAMYK